MDQTRISIAIPLHKNWPQGVIPVQDRGDCSGLLLFSVTSSSRQAVDITRIAMDHDATLQLLDPGNRGFFVSADAANDDLPFRIAWQGIAPVRSNLQQAFAVVVKFCESVQEHRIRFAIHARRVRGQIGGFEHQGRIRVTSKEFKIRLTSEAIHGLTVPPKCGMSSPQPFLIESAVTASGGPGPVLVHERMADGTVSTRRIEIPSTNPLHPGGRG